MQYERREHCARLFIMLGWRVDVVHDEVEGGVSRKKSLIRFVCPSVLPASTPTPAPTLVALTSPDTCSIAPRMPFTRSEGMYPFITTT